jgi:hypothetical protein
MQVAVQTPEQRFAELDAIIQATYPDPCDPDDVLNATFNGEHICTGFMHDEEQSMLLKAGVDVDTDSATFIEMNGRNVFVTEV